MSLTFIVSSRQMRNVGQKLGQLSRFTKSHGQPSDSKFEFESDDDDGNDNDDNDAEEDLDLEQRQCPVTASTATLLLGKDVNLRSLALRDLLSSEQLYVTPPSTQPNLVDIDDDSAMDDEPDGERL
ncbi:hypothetical protein EVG20_g11629 [Dentipellis fragilis]|uniref:Uncharacterized protein n=1 Tax=Dentipellis fragilis TaxID=205917 RepID=A0A4Y9XM36_9AGAM|nr:hypothetical protein EVG20_g11629 [Dentipellis fragilis]